MKIIITGAGGMLGSALASRFAGKNDKYEVIVLSRADLDIRDLEKIKEVFKASKPDVVINGAAYTGVDKAERERELAFGVNSDGVENLAICASEVGAKLVHFSTDFVFDGSGTKPYKEDDRTSPIGVYGESKLEGEARLQKISDNFLIIRTSWLYGPKGKNFVTAIMNKVTSESELNVVCDQYGSPTYTIDLAEATEKLLEKDGRGIYNFSNDSGESGMSWHEFAVGIWGQMVFRDMPYTIASVGEVTTEQYPTPAKRPKYSVLDTAKYTELTGSKPPDWKEALIRYFNSLPKTFPNM